MNATDEQKMILALKQAVLTIDAIYQWVDRIETAGGTTSMEGIAVAHAMIASMKKNRARVGSLIAVPLRNAMLSEKGDTP